MQSQEGRCCSHLSNILAMLNTQINTLGNSKMMTYAARSLITSSPTRDRYGSIKSITKFAKGYCGRAASDFWGTQRHSLKSQSARCRDQTNNASKQITLH